jgi:hypothetical protein
MEIYFGFKTWGISMQPTHCYCLDSTKVESASTLVESLTSAHRKSQHLHVGSIKQTEFQKLFAADLPRQAAKELNAQ